MSAAHTIADLDFAVDGFVEARESVPLHRGLTES